MSDTRGADIQRHEQEQCEDPPPKCERHPTVYLYREDCGTCGGDGESAPGELYEEDPLWYDEDDTEPCSACSARGWFYECSACMRGEPVPSGGNTTDAPEAPSK